MRVSAKWMTLVDERLLELIDEEGPKSQSTASDDSRIGYNVQYVGRRLRKLADAGLLQHIGNGMYTITDEGEAYLEGNLDARTLPDPTD